MIFNSFVVTVHIPLYSVTCMYWFKARSNCSQWICGKFLCS